MGRKQFLIKKTWTLKWDSGYIGHMFSQRFTSPLFKELFGDNWCFGKAKAVTVTEHSVCPLPPSGDFTVYRNRDEFSSLFPAIKTWSKTKWSQWKLLTALEFWLVLGFQSHFPLYSTLFISVLITYIYATKSNRTTIIKLHNTSKISLKNFHNYKFFTDSLCNWIKLLSPSGDERGSKVPN